MAGVGVLPDDGPVTDTSALVAALTDLLPGRVVTPGDPAFDPAALVAFDPGPVKPAAIVRPRDARDVARILPLVGEAGLAVTVRTGGHSYAGRSLVDGGVVLDLADLDAVEIDPATSTGRAGGGTTAGRYTSLAGEHGLATGFGDTGGVGIAGLTLGGGMGLLSRRFGLTVDDLLGAELVTADGRVLEVDDDREPDLFWALRGGGAGLGVVTGLRFRLHPVTTVTQGMLFFEPDAELLAALVAYLADAPDELASMVNVMAAPPIPILPAERHGRPVIMLLLVHSGDPGEAQRLVADVRAMASPLAERVAQVPYSGVFGEFGFHGMGVVTGTGFADEFGTQRAAHAVDTVTSGGRAIVNLRPMGGAIARVAADATAFAHRDRRVMVTVLSLAPDRATAQLAASAVDELTSSLTDGIAGYVNFLRSRPDAAERAYPPATRERLAAVRAAYDPGNLFRAQ